MGDVAEVFPAGTLIVTLCSESSSNAMFSLRQGSPSKALGVTAEGGVQTGKSSIHKDAVVNTAGDEEDQGGPAEIGW